jgi:hypothetical protein
MMWYALYLCFFIGLARYWYPWCCCGDSPPCAKCTSDADTVAVTITGFSAGSSCTEASCDLLEGTYVLPRQVWDPCWYQKIWSRGCTTAMPIAGTYTIRAWVGPVPVTSNWGWNVTLTFTYGIGLAYTETAYYKWDSGGTSAFDCTATRSMTYVSAAGGLGCSGCECKCWNTGATDCHVRSS